MTFRDQIDLDSAVFANESEHAQSVVIDGVSKTIILERSSNGPVAGMRDQNDELSFCDVVFHAVNSEFSALPVRGQRMVFAGRPHRVASSSELEGWITVGLERYDA